MVCFGSKGVDGNEYTPDVHAASPGWWKPDVAPGWKILPEPQAEHVRAEAGMAVGCAGVVAVITTLP